MSQTPVITACLRSFGRPLRTQRMLECIGKQTFTNFELLFMGDGCPHFAAIIKTDWFKQWQQDFKTKGNRVFYFNQARPHNDWGAWVTNISIKMATGKYFVFLDNDDTILPEHVEYYYRSISMFERETTPADFVANKTMVYNAGHKWIMEPKMEHGKVGHGSLIVRTDFLKQQPAHQPVYGQDWLLIEQMMKTGRGEIGNILFPTYCVMSTPAQPEPGMENDN